MVFEVELNLLVGWNWLLRPYLKNRDAVVTSFETLCCQARCWSW